MALFDTMILFIKGRMTLWLEEGFYYGRRKGAQPAVNAYGARTLTKGQASLWRAFCLVV